MNQMLHAKILGDGNALIILHGLLGMGDNWITLGRKFANKGFQVHLIDQRNHGKSFHDDEMNYEVMVEDLHHYLSENKLTNISLLGHSMGGKTAMNFALKYPDLVKKMIIVDIAPKYYPPHHLFIFEAIEKLDLSIPRRRQELEKDLSQYIESSQIRQFILKNLGRKSDGTFYWKPNISVLKQSLSDLGQALPPMSSIPTDTLFIKGADSPYILKEDLSLIHAHFPKADITTITNSGHWVHAQQPKDFFQSSVNFLNRIY